MMKDSELQDIKKRYNIVGNCDALNHALDVALQVAPTDLSVLIIGESGVGKEIIPRVIHDRSPRRREKYFAINCGSIPEGIIESELFGHEKGSFTGAINDSPGYFGAADKGTLFLDEVGELPLSTQARLLRVLETGEYISVGATSVKKTNVRIVAATNVNMTRAISEGKFREDLYYRLNSIPIMMPPLRERGNDIVLLFRLFAMQMAEKYKIERVTLDEDAKDLLLKYKWPGNVRQLKNITDQISILSPSRLVTADIMRQFIPQDYETTEIVSMGKRKDGEHSFENERELLYKILFDLRGNVSELRQDVEMLKHKLNIASDVTMGNAKPAALTAKPLLLDNKKHVAEDAIAEEYVEPKNNNHNNGYSSVITPSDSLYNDGKAIIDDDEDDDYDELQSLNLKNMSKNYIEKALERANGNRKRAADELGISDRTLYRWLKRFGIAVVAALVMLTATTACQVSYKFNGASIDYSKTKTIQIADFPIRSSYVWGPMASIFNNQLKDQFANHTKLIQVKRNGDLKIEGEITRYEQRNKSVSSEGYSSQTELSMTVKVRITNNVNHTEDFEQQFTATSTYDNTQSLNAVQEELVTQMVKEITEQIFNATVANW